MKQLSRIGITLLSTFALVSCGDGGKADAKADVIQNTIAAMESSPKYDSNLERTPILQDHDDYEISTDVYLRNISSEDNKAFDILVNVSLYGSITVKNARLYIGFYDSHIQLNMRASNDYSGVSGTTYYVLEGSLDEGYTLNSSEFTVGFDSASNGVSVTTGRTLCRSMLLSGLKPYKNFSVENNLDYKVFLPNL